MSSSRTSQPADPPRLWSVRPAPEIVPGSSNQVEKPRGTTCKPGGHPLSSALSALPHSFIGSFAPGLLTAGSLRGSSASLTRSSLLQFGLGQAASLLQLLGCRRQAGRRNVARQGLQAMAAPVGPA